MKVVEPIDSEVMLQGVLAAGITHIVHVPDSCQARFLELARSSSAIEVVTAATEDQAIGINAGLILGGKRSMVSMQHTGLWASMNTIRGVAIDMRVPTFLLVGLYRRDVNKFLSEHDSVGLGRFIQLMDSVDYLRFHNMDTPIKKMDTYVPYWYEDCLKQRYPTALILGRAMV